MKANRNGYLACVWVVDTQVLYKMRTEGMRGLLIRQFIFFLFPSPRLSESTDPEKGPVGENQDVAEAELSDRHLPR